MIFSKSMCFIKALNNPEVGLSLLSPLDSNKNFSYNHLFNKMRKHLVNSVSGVALRRATVQLASAVTAQPKTCSYGALKTLKKNSHIHIQWEGVEKREEMQRGEKVHRPPWCTCAYLLDVY
jgi:hypothetical protein